MYRNTKKENMYALTRPVRTITRSDGREKVYGWSEDGKLLTVVMAPNMRGGYDMTEIRKGKTCLYYE